MYNSNFLRQYVYALKFRGFIKLLMVALIATSCSSENDVVNLVNNNPLLNTAPNFNDVALSVTEDVSVGSAVATLTATDPDDDSLNYAIIDGDDNDTFTIDSLTGEITLNAELNMATTPSYTLTATASDGEFFDTATVTITVTERTGPCENPIFNRAIWEGTVNVEDEGYGTAEVTALANSACNQLIISGDLYNLGCADTPAPELVLTFTPDSAGSTTGTVTGERQAWDCDDGSTYSWEFEFPSGTYDESSGIIEIEYILYGNGSQLDANTFIISSGCSSTVNTSIWNGSISSEDVGYGTASVTGSAGCGTLTVAGDLYNAGCADTPVPELVLTFTPDSAGSTTGTVTGERQAWDCDDGSTYSWEFEFPSGTYDESSGIIEIEYILYGNGSQLDANTFIISPGCSSTVNTSIWNGSISSEDVGYGTASVTGSAGCGTLTVVGDLYNAGCADTPVPELVLTFTPDSAGSTTGTVTAERQAWNCDAGGPAFEFEFPSGTYDESTGIIEVQYIFYGDGEQFDANSFIIQPE